MGEVLNTNSVSFIWANVGLFQLTFVFFFEWAFEFVFFKHCVCLIWIIFSSFNICRICDDVFSFILGIVFFLLLMVSLARGLWILLIFSKNLDLFVLLIFFISFFGGIKPFYWGALGDRKAGVAMTSDVLLWAICPLLSCWKADFLFLVQILFHWFMLIFIFFTYFDFNLYY